MAFDDRELLARIIRCEAEGEGFDGMMAVATVVMNRRNAATGEYLRVCQGDLQRVIFQPGQFSCAMTQTADGMPTSRNIYTTPPEPIHYEIADLVLGGSVFGGIYNSLWFLNPYGTCRPYFPLNQSGSFHTLVNNHCFYRPTPKYDTT